MSKAQATAEENATKAAADKKKAASKAQEMDLGAGLGDLDRVRSILFGTQSREYERRFASLEELVARELGALKESVERRFEDLEAFVKKQDESLSKRLTSEQQQRADGEKKLGKEIQDVVQALQDNRTQLDEHIMATEGALREEILEQGKKAARDMERGFETLTGRLEENTATLRDEKADRHSLADLFDELSARLRNSFQLPTDEL